MTERAENLDQTSENARLLLREISAMLDDVGIPHRIGSLTLSTAERVQVLTKRALPTDKKETRQDAEDR